MDACMSLHWSKTLDCSSGSIDAGATAPPSGDDKCFELPLPPPEPLQFHVDDMARCARDKTSTDLCIVVRGRCLPAEAATARNKIVIVEMSEQIYGVREHFWVSLRETPPDLGRHRHSRCGQEEGERRKEKGFSPSQSACLAVLHQDDGQMGIDVMKTRYPTGGPHNKNGKSKNTNLHTRKRHGQPRCHLAANHRSAHGSTTITKIATSTSTTTRKHNNDGLGL